MSVVRYDAGQRLLCLWANICSWPFHVFSQEIWTRQDCKHFSHALGKSVRVCGGGGGGGAKSICKKVSISVTLRSPLKSQLQSHHLCFIEAEYGGGTPGKSGSKGDIILPLIALQHCKGPE